MYEKVFQLHSRPFISSPDASRFFSAAAIHDALMLACSTIERASGTVVVVGPTGAGKTLFLKMLEEQFGPVYHVVNLACARLTNRTELLQSIMFELDQPYTNMTEGELRLGLIDYLKPGEHCPNGLLLLVDEAQMLPPELLDEIRLLTNFVREGRPRAQLVLAGGAKLEEILMDPSLESFNQRIAARCYLENFSQAETCQFVQNAVVNAGGSEDNPIFTQDALFAVHKHTQGCPRLVNQLCDYAMIVAATANNGTIDVDNIHEAWSDVQALPNQWASSSSKTCKPKNAEPVSAPAPSTIELEPSQFRQTADTVEYGELSETSSEPATALVESEEQVRPLSSFTEAEISQASVADGEASTDELPEGASENWTVIEFDTLLPEESNELAAASDFDDSREQETVLEFGQLDEEPAPTLTTYADSGQRADVEAETDSADSEGDEESEYQLAPIEDESNSEVELEPSNYETVAEEIGTETASDMYATADNYDDRFDELAKFLGETEQEPIPKVSEATQEPYDDLTAELHEEIAANWQLETDQADQVDQQPTFGIVSDEDEFVETADETPESSFDKHEPAENETGWPEPIYDEVENVEPQVESDPFGEQFEKEEVVYDPYAEIVARQNMAALNITREQLNVLDAMIVQPPLAAKQRTDQGDGEDVPMAKEIQAPSEAVERVAAEEQLIPLDTTEPSIVAHSDDSQNQFVEETELAESVEVTAQADPEVDENDLLKSIQMQQEEIASQIYRLKMDFSEANIETGHVDSEESPQNEHDQLADQYAFVPHQFSDSDSSDDKDLLIVQPQERIESNSDEEDESEQAVNISKGRAIRMEYSELFNQLRAAE